MLGDASISELIDYLKLLNLAEVRLIERTLWLTGLIKLNLAGLSLPPSLRRLRYHFWGRRALWVVGFVGLVIGLAGAFPALALGSLVLGTVWFFVERRWLPPNELKKLKAQGLLVKEISDQITQFQDKVQQLRAAERVARNAEPSLPGIATRVIASVIRGRRPLAEEVAEALRVLAPTDYSSPNDTDG